MLVQPKMYQQLEDPETGCVEYGTANLEQCKQTYYLKQQNEILRQQQPQANLQQENTELKSQLKQLRGELNAIKSQTLIQPVTDNGNLLASISSVNLPTILLVGAVGIVIISLAAWRFFRRRGEYQVHFFRKTPKFPLDKSNQ